MESPYYRPEAAKLIYAAIKEHDQATLEGRCGFGLGMYIYEVLKRAQYLTESAQEVNGI